MYTAFAIHPKPYFQRIFDITNLIVMQNQYCKVGTVTPITSGNHAVAVLKFRYQSFLEKAADATYMNTNLGDFFNRKAQELKKVLESLG